MAQEEIRVEALEVEVAQQLVDGLLGRLAGRQPPAAPAPLFSPTAPP